MANTYPFFSLKITQEQYVNFLSNHAFTLEWLHFCIRALVEEHGYTGLASSAAYQATHPNHQYEQSNNPDGQVSTEAEFLALIANHCTAVYDESVDRGDAGTDGHDPLSQTSHAAIIRSKAIAWPEHVDAHILHITSQRVILWWPDDEYIQYVTDAEELDYVTHELPRLAEMQGDRARSSWFSPIADHVTEHRILAGELGACSQCQAENDFWSVRMECGHDFHKRCIEKHLVRDVESEGNAFRRGRCPACPAELCHDLAMPGDEVEEAVEE